MKKILFLLVSFSLFNGTLFSQGYSNTMVFGYAGGSLSPNDDGFGLNVLTFPEGSLSITDNQTGEAFFNDTDAAISDDDGNLLFYFNGIDVFDKEHLVMDNGDTLNDFSSSGYDLPQGAIIIPYPEHVDKYLLFYSEEGYYAPWGLANVAVYFAEIDMTQNNGLGKVVRRDELVIADSLEYGKLAMVRHANGRDWWLAIGEAHHNAFYRVLIDPYGVHLIGKQSVGTERKYGIGLACFSNDGNKYVSSTSIVYAGEYHYLDIYDFDRCTGLFSNHEHFHLPIPKYGGGGVISPNSRWLYFDVTDTLYKYDLWASPVEPTREIIATYEPFNDPFPTKFDGGYLAPDDKIYIVTTSGSRTLHVINKPDEPGTACDFVQHGIRLACYNANSIPTYANYRLGPVDGSSCDSLGIDNIPVSWWRYEQDTVQHARFEFRDLSYHEPVAWLWDFGDGTTSVERHPVHEYAVSGTYQVCLTVSNPNGSDVHCKTIYSTVAVKDNPAVVSSIAVSPNPFQKKLAVSLGVPMQSPVLLLYDQTGRLVHTEPLGLGITEIETGHLQPGLYFWSVMTGGERVKSGKLLKL